MPAGPQPEERNLRSEETSLAAEMVRRLEHEILHGERAPGDRLDERQLASQYGVSRTPVREALQRLAASGLAVARGRQGLQVAQLSVTGLLDAFSVVAELEGLAAAQAARRILPAQLQTLKAAHEAAAVAAENDDIDAFYKANLDFHDAIAAGSQNDVLKDELRRLTIKTTPYRRVITSQPGRMKSSVPEHLAILEAIAAGKPADATKAMRSHVNVLGDGLTDFLHILRLSDGPIQFRRSEPAELAAARRIARS